MANVKKILTIAPHTDRPDPPRLSSVREKIRKQRHLAAMRSGPQLCDPEKMDGDPESLGAMPRRDGWDPNLATMSY